MKDSTSVVLLPETFLNTILRKTSYNSNSGTFYKITGLHASNVKVKKYKERPWKYSRLTGDERNIN